MKARGKHPEKALTAVQVRSISKPGRYADGNGLYLTVDPSGAKRWMLRTIVQGRRRDIGLGGLSLSTLAEAREKALVYRKVARRRRSTRREERGEGGHRTNVRRSLQVHNSNAPSWRNPKQAAQWISSLRAYANPIIGARRVDELDTPDIFRVLTPIWLTQPETALRVRRRIGTVLDRAKAAGSRTGENPIAGVAKGLPKQGDKDTHRAALPYAEVPAFVAKLRGSIEEGEIARLAFEFLILTAARTGEVLGATWSEVDETEKVRTIPAKGMKAGREHRVPLALRARDPLAGEGNWPATASTSSPGSPDQSRCRTWSS